MTGAAAPHGRQVAVGPLGQQVLEVGDEAADGPMAVGPAHQLGQVFGGGVKAVLHGAGRAAPGGPGSQLGTGLRSQGGGAHARVLPRSCLLLACEERAKPCFSALPEHGPCSACFTLTSRAPKHASQKPLLLILPGKPALKPTLQYTAEIRSGFLSSAKFSIRGSMI